VPFESVAKPAGQDQATTLKSPAGTAGTLKGAAEKAADDHTRAPQSIGRALADPSETGWRRHDAAIRVGLVDGFELSVRGKAVERPPVAGRLVAYLAGRRHERYAGDAAYHPTCHPLSRMWCVSADLGAEDCTGD
jgi:hypothetical protein